MPAQQHYLMLREIKNTSQKRGEPKKRWFSSLSMDVFVWIDDAGEIVSYQFTYNKPQDEKALVWRKDQGYSHLGVDDGVQPGKYPGSPIFIADGSLDPENIIAMLRRDQGELEPWIADFIVSGIETHFK